MEIVKCSNCGRPLKTKKSRARKIGPVCWDKILKSQNLVKCKGNKVLKSLEHWVKEDVRVRK